MRKSSDLERMSYAQLRALRDQVETAMVAAQANERQQIRAKMEALAAEAGLTLTEVLGNGKSTNKLAGRQVPIKYRNPKDTSQTWTGRGRKPLWLVAAIKKGQKLDTFLV